MSVLNMFLAAQSQRWIVGTTIVMIVSLLSFMSNICNCHRVYVVFFFFLKKIDELKATFKHAPINSNFTSVWIFFVELYVEQYERKIFMLNMPLHWLLLIIGSALKSKSVAKEQAKLINTS